MTVREKIGKLFMIGLNGKNIDYSDKNLLNLIKPGFIILFKRNVENRIQVKKYVSKIHETYGDDIIISADQEGGIVTRLETGFSVSPGAMAVAATGKSTNSYLTGKILGEEMADCGITFNLAPVVDINSNQNNPAIGVRSFSNDSEIVYEYASEFIRGLNESGVAACIKHFPGNGDVCVDPHLAMPILDKTIEELEKMELIPFRKLFERKVESMMPTHLTLPKIMKEKVPVTVSKEILTDFVRGEMGYEGLIISDDLTMGGVSNSMEIEEICYKSLMAGIDVLCICHDHDLKERAFNYLCDKYVSDCGLRSRVDESFERIEKFVQKYRVKKNDVKIIDYDDNQRTMQSISDKSITFIDGGQFEFPLEDLGCEDYLFSVKPMRQTLAEDSEIGSCIGRFLIDKFPHLNLITFKGNISIEESDKLIEKSEGKTCIFISENAYLNVGQRNMLEKLADKFERILLIAIRNPYDSSLKGIKNSILSYGYSMPNQESVISLLQGNIKSEGNNPIKYY